ncbi:hypothetical protein [Actinophytocola sp.]|uniref:hypothetical protein n=1 Tax=Actinophytocola sp. TaxID=1872138 RepID=UPI0025BA8CBC|nr:hypothetical protein [Actinophytocola sp.]
MTASTTPVAATMPRPAMILRLVAGRGTFRISVQVMSVALATVWAADSFGHFTNALGLCAWLPLATATPEKAALKVLPRTRLLTPTLARMVLGLSAAPVLALLVVLAPVAVLAPTSAATTYLAAATWAAGTGLLMTVAGLNRLRGRPSLDAGAFGASAVVVVVVTATTWQVEWAPQFHLLLLVGGIVLVTGCALAALPREWVRPGPRPGHRLLPRLARTTSLLGVSDIADALGASVIYLVLAASGQVTDSGPLYLALIASTTICQFLFYLLRVAQPATSARLRGTGGDAGRLRALGLLRGAGRFGGGFAAVFAVLATVPATRELLLGAGAGLPVVLGVLVCVEIGLFLTVMFAGYLLENTDNKILVVTSSSALVGLLAAGVFAVALVPVLGAVGGIVVLVLALTVKAHTMRRMLLRTRPELRARTAPAAPSPTTTP